NDNTRDDHDFVRRRGLARGGVGVVSAAGELLPNGLVVSDNYRSGGFHDHFPAGFARVWPADVHDDNPAQSSLNLTSRRPSVNRKAAHVIQLGSMTHAPDLIQRLRRMLVACACRSQREIRT